MRRGRPVSMQRHLGAELFLGRLDEETRQVFSTSSLGGFAFYMASWCLGLWENSHTMLVWVPSGLTHEDGHLLPTG
jgi:hypothetical protein